MRYRATAAVAGIAVVLVGGGVALPVLLDSRHSEAGTGVSSGMRAVRVERTSLAQGTVIQGTLSRGEVAPLNALGDGIVTWLPTPGTVLKPGDRLFESNGRPTFLLHGEVPLWRPLQLGSRGKDVSSLNSALADAGYLDRDLADDVFGSGTSMAIAQLFREAGYEPPTETEDGREEIERMESTYSSAVEELDAAEETLTLASRRPSSLQRSEADAIVEEAKEALSVAEATGRGQAAAQARYDAALAERAGLDIAPDVTEQRDTVTAAANKVTEAAADLQIARSERLSPADVAILDADRIRVGATPVRVGEPASGAVLEWSGTEVYAEADVTRSQETSLSVGDNVSVTLPDGSKVPGTITSTGGAAVNGEADLESESAGAGEAGDSNLVTMRVKIDAQKKVAGSVGAAVRIEVAGASVDDALVVPVTALVALVEGGYAVEKVMPDSAAGAGKLVRVDLGLVAETRAQVTSAELHEGDEVLVP